MTILWDVPPPARLPRSFIRLLVVKPGERFHVARLGPVVGLITHWVPPKTVACIGESQCPVHDRPQTWKGFCPAVQVFSRASHEQQKCRETVLVVTEEIAADAAALPIGTIAEICRRGPKANSPLMLTPLGRKLDGDLPPTFNVRPYVLRAMGFPLDLSGNLRQAVRK